MDHSTRASTSSASSARVVDVLVPVALNQAYSYRVPRGMDLAPGDVVCVPLGPRGVVVVGRGKHTNPPPPPDHPHRGGKKKPNAPAVKRGTAQPCRLGRQ